MPHEIIGILMYLPISGLQMLSGMFASQEGADGPPSRYNTD